MKTYTLEYIAELLNAELIRKVGLVDPEISGIETLSNALATHVSFLSTPKYAKELPSTQAGAVIVTSDQVEHCPTHALVMKDPYLGFAKLAHLFDESPKLQGKSASAFVSPSAQVPDSVSLGANVVIGENVQIGDACQIHPGVVIAANSVIGSETILYPNVTVYHSVRMGQRCIIHAGSVIGSDGFGLANDSGRWQKIPQLGTVIIEDDVEIGAACTIDRGALGDTVIQTGVKLDNQIQVAHNVEIGAHTAMAAQSAVAGSAKIGKYCMIGGASAISGHIELADQVIVTGMSGVSKSIHEPGVYSSSPQARERKTWFRALANLYRVDKLLSTLKQLERRIGQLEKRN